MSLFKAAQSEEFETPGAIDQNENFHSDMADFQADVLGGSDKSFASQIIDNFANYSDGLAQKKVDFESALTKASETGNPDDVYAATKAMGDYQLQVLLATKVASKSSSAIDKLTNLQ